ncbi:MAG: tail fiber protein [Rickettsiales bacterium]|jgi:hypothetical protein|nr:tail fiber protein [Rickettsiales bacterium]
MTEITSIGPNSGFSQIATTGGETVMDFTFPIFDEDYIRVSRTDKDGNETILSLGDDYTVQGVGNESGGTITLVNPALPGEIYTMLLNVPAERETDFQQAGDFFARDLNRELDIITQRDQQLNRDSKNVIRFPDADLNAPNSSVIPGRKARKYKVLNFDGNGNLAVNVDVRNIADIDEAVKESKEAAQEATGAAAAAEAAAAVVVPAVAAEASTRLSADTHLQQQIDSANGKGGALPHHDFGPSEDATGEDLTFYASQSIWGGGGEFTWNPDNPAASTYVIDGTTHAAGEIFNSTWVRNDADNHRFVLTNTPDTAPAVYDWADVGIDTVAQATDELSGVAKLYNSASGQNTDGAPTQKAVSDAIDGVVPVIYVDSASDVQAKLNDPSVPVGAAIGDPDPSEDPDLMKTDASNLTSAGMAAIISALYTGTRSHITPSGTVASGSFARIYINNTGKPVVLSGTLI